MALKTCFPRIEADGARCRLTRGGWTFALVAACCAAWSKSVKTRTIFGDDGYHGCSGEAAAQDTSRNLSHDSGD